MLTTQAPPTAAPVTRRAEAGFARTASFAPEPGERGHLQHLLVSAIRTRHYSKSTNVEPH
ncbi:hypothetical protein UFOVP726_48 [uncultured Caudovirales phage]|uniref:Uncharacterized protein n=1 Tax=uncultured Caudovirales phage TaxID=2100421 RepID=A0A6J5NJ20_9CAUD|nr:hypothetical protein UFOVP726_48 [uncultured Caudovirales phage]